MDNFERTNLVWHSTYSLHVCGLFLKMKLTMTPDVQLLCRPMGFGDVKVGGVWEFTCPQAPSPFFKPNLPQKPGKEENRSRESRGGGEKVGVPQARDTALESTPLSVKALLFPITPSRKCTCFSHLDLKDSHGNSGPTITR